MPRLFTIGYSGLDSERFVNLLQMNHVQVVCDVRSTPYSTYKPEFSRGAFRKFLNLSGIKYVFMGDQLGARPKDRSCYVNGQAMYEKISRSDFFRDGITRVRMGAQKMDLALVCSERDPIDCHRAVLVCRNLPDLWPVISHIHTDGCVEAQSLLDERLVDRQDTAPPPLLRQPGDWSKAVDLAYQKQGEAIAFREQDSDRSGAISK